MNFLEKLDLLMEANNINKNILSKKSGIPYTTIDGFYKKGYQNAKLPTIQKIAKFFDVTLDYLMLDDITDTNYGKTNNFIIEKEEMYLVEEFRLLSTLGREAIKENLQSLRKYENQQFKQQIKPLPEDINEDLDDYGDNVVLMPSLIQKICAGTGSIGDDIQLEEVPYPALRVPHGAKYAATISGDSMEPKYSDGDVIFFDDNPCPELGDIVVMNINEENYIKKYTKDGFEALNQKYDTIVPGEDDHVAVYGKVLGKL